MKQMEQCGVCGGFYYAIQDDGSLYTHTCPPPRTAPGFAARAEAEAQREELRRSLTARLSAAWRTLLGKE